MEQLRTKYLRLLNSVEKMPKRYLYDEINWQERLIILKGQRGTGKTTLVLQHVKTAFNDYAETLYVSLDDIYFSAHTLTELADEFVTDGGKYLFIDEAHRYKGWSRELKNIYDFYPELQLVVTGSSALSFYISSSDLSRRAAVYNLPELSFREYLNFMYNTSFKEYNLKDIINNHEQIALEINSKIRSVKLFREYLHFGAYPFIFNGQDKYFDKLASIINMVIDNDIPAIENITFDSRQKLKKLLLMMATSTPFKVNISELSRKIVTTRDVLTKYIDLLNKAGLIKLLTTEGVGYTVIRKPDKIYFSNTNLMYAIYSNIDKGTERETFFLNQLSNNYNVAYAKYGDFFVADKYTFEVGGKTKSFKQIENIADSYLAVDDIEFGFKNKIPLWLFGFLY